jgi:hypothetical protein
MFLTPDPFAGSPQHSTKCSRGPRPPHSPGAYLGPQSVRLNFPPGRHDRNYRAARRKGTGQRRERAGRDFEDKAPGCGSAGTLEGALLFRASPRGRGGHPRFGHSPAWLSPLSLPALSPPVLPILGLFSRLPPPSALRTSAVCDSFPLCPVTHLDGILLLFLKYASWLRSAPAFFLAELNAVELRRLKT